MFRKLTLAAVAAASLGADGAGSDRRFGGRRSGRITIITTTGVMATASGSASSVAAAMTAAT